MKSTRGVFLYVTLAAVLLVSNSAKADTVTVTLTGVSGGVQGNVYTSPYYATIGSNQNVPIVCDDYGHEVYMGESWTALVSTFADLSNARFWQGSQSLQLYEQAAYLFNQLYLYPSQGGNISFALWAIFDPTAVETAAGWTTGGTTTNPTSAAGWLANAQGQSFTAGEFSNFEVLTPCTQTSQGLVCPSTLSSSPQEYLVRTPEPSTLFLLIVALAAVPVLKRLRLLQFARF